LDKEIRKTQACLPSFLPFFLLSHTFPPFLSLDLLGLLLVTFFFSNEIVGCFVYLHEEFDLMIVSEFKMYVGMGGLLDLFCWEGIVLTLCGLNLFFHRSTSNEGGLSWKSKSLVDKEDISIIWKMTRIVLGILEDIYKSCMATFCLHDFMTS
jgi:hypothetical protein